MLEGVSLEALKGKKNLLAFSGGVDSTALFFLLMEADIEFDIAIVNYNTRASSKDEEEYAKELADIYGKKCFTLSVSPPEKNFEAEARRIRYGFFEKIIKEHSYHNLVTAHQLNDRLEWFLMRLAKGAGIRELIGATSVQKRGGYTVVKPLFKTSREAICDYLKSSNKKYFEDSSNEDTKYERNAMRAEFATPFIQKYENGVRRSFDILESQASLFVQKFFEQDSLIVFCSSGDVVDGTNIALALKKLGYLISGQQRAEILKNYDAVVGGNFAVSKNKKGLIFVSPFAKVDMDEKFKDTCRRLDIPPKNRGYLFASGIDVRSLAVLLEGSFSAL